MTTRKQNNGYVISDIVDGRLVEHLYIGYSKRDALKMFRKRYKSHD